jgi:hypothetical protein
LGLRAKAAVGEGIPPLRAAWHIRQLSGDLTKLQLFFFLGRNCKGFAKFDCTITDYEARGRAFSKGGGVML